MTYALEAVELTKCYGRIEALKNLTFSIPQGEIVAFLGPNSAGKTSTLKILAGIMPATSGEATVAGYSAAYQSREVKRHVGYMPEHNPLPEEVTIEEYLTYRARLKEITGRRVKQRVQAVASLCELGGKLLNRPIGVLSRGVRQRVGIAEALLTEPPILLLDEPTIGLDPHQVLSLRDLIRSMRGRHTVLLSTHILSEAEVMTDRLLIINKGKKVAFGTPAELRAKYNTTNRLCVVCAVPPEVMKKLLLEVQGTVLSADQEAAGIRYLISLPREELSVGLLQAISAIPGAHITEFVCQKPTLESIFIQATAQGDDL